MKIMIFYTQTQLWFYFIQQTILEAQGYYTIHRCLSYNVHFFEMKIKSSSTIASSSDLFFSRSVNCNLIGTFNNTQTQVYNAIVISRTHNTFADYLSLSFKKKKKRKWKYDEGLECKRLLCYIYTIIIY